VCESFLKAPGILLFQNFQSSYGSSRQTMSWIEARRQNAAVRSVSYRNRIGSAACERRLSGTLIRQIISGAACSVSRATFVAPTTVAATTQKTAIRTSPVRGRHSYSRHVSRWILIFRLIDPLRPVARRLPPRRAANSRRYERLTAGAAVDCRLSRLEERADYVRAACRTDK